MRFRVGDYVTLAYPNARELRGSEAEIVKIVSMLDDLYNVRISKTGQIVLVRENQLEPLEPANTPSTWEECAWRPKSG